MGKDSSAKRKATRTRSAVGLTIITILLAALIVFFFISFPCGDINYFNSVLALTSKDADLGDNLIGDTAYVGGGYSAVYYPDGVISSKEYEENCSDLSGDDLTEYQDKYVAYGTGAIYLEKDVVCDGGTEVSEEFKETFERELSMITARYEKLQTDGTRVQIANDYTVKVFLPETMEAAATAFEYLSYMGEFSLSFGDDEDTATTIIPAQKGTKHEVGYYLKGASVRSSSGTYYVVVSFTDEGQETVADATEEDTGSIYFHVGDNHILTLTVDEQIDQAKLYISGSYTKDTANIVAALMDSAIKEGDSDDFSMTLSDISREEAAFGENALLFLYLAIAVCIVGMLLFFFIRYRRLAFAHLYTFLMFVMAMLICVWSISTLSIGMGTVTAFLLTAAMLSLSNVFTFESVRSLRATGKVMDYSVKMGYKKCMWHIFDLHIAMIAAGLLMWLVGLTELSMFGLTFMLGAIFSCVGSLLVNRFMWYIMMNLAKDGDKFCHFKVNEEAYADED